MPPAAAAANPYDEVPYVGHAYNFTHPDRLAVLGALFGLQPAPVEGCRVLELGCGDAANLLPMACTLPGSRFLGIDLASKPIEQGRASAARLGLTNLELAAMDILEFPPSAGEFDYIVAHGIFSWVPAPVREKLLAICGAHLAPNGVAFVSYKTFPGSYATATIHEMLRYQASRQPRASEAEIVRAGVDMLRLVVASRPELDALRAPLKWRLDSIDERTATRGGYAWIYHDLGVEISEPVYFHRFMAQAARHGLQFLSETDLPTPASAHYTPETVRALDALGDDVVAREQYDDFLAHREFRRTLLCRASAPVDRTLSPARVYPLYAASSLAATGPAAPVDDPLGKQEFAVPAGGKVIVDQPAIKAAFRRLGEVWPRAASFDELLAASALPGPAAGQESRGEDAAGLATALLAVFRAGLISLTTRAPRLATTAGERPLTSARARQQIADGLPLVTNLRHVEVEVEDAGVRQVLALLDGTRDREGVARDLRAWLEGMHPTASGLGAGWSAEDLEAVLKSLAAQQFLVA